MDTNTPSKPRPGLRPTTLAIRPDQWDTLQANERETGASPSFVVRKLLDSWARKPRARQSDQPPPAA